MATWRKPEASVWCPSSAWGVLFAWFLSFLTAAAAPLSIAHWGTDEGLGPGGISAILQTHNGYLWFGSEEGLTRFDGVRCKVYNSENTPEFRVHRVSVLFEDRQANLWVGTAGGGLLRRSDDGRFTAFGRKEGLANERVSAMGEDTAGNLWVGTDGGGLFRLTSEGVEAFEGNARLPSSHIRALLPAHPSGLWVGSNSQLCRIDSGQVDTNSIARGHFPSDSVALLSKENGELWIGSADGLFSLRGDECVRVAPEAGDLRQVEALCAGADGQVWVGTPRGLVHLDGGNRRHFTTDHGLSGNLIYCIYRGQEGSIWIASDVPGVDQIRATKFAVLSTPHGLSHPIATGIFEDDQGALWIGTHQGINRYASNRITRWLESDGLAGNLVFTMGQDRHGQLWVGAYDGLSLFTGGRFRTFTTTDGLPHNAIWCLYRDRSEKLWAGTPRGLVQIKDNSFEVLNHENAGLTHNDVRALCEDAHGQLWVGTSYGLNLYKNGRFVQFTEWAPGRPLNAVLALHADADGDLWIGTMEQGLFRFRDGAFVNFSRPHGMHDNLIFQILEDNSGSLWLTCNRGIFRVDKGELHRFAQGGAGRIDCQVFGRPDGLPTGECNGTFQPAGCKTKDGRLWFPTTKGVAVVDPQRLPQNDSPPPVRVEEVFLNGKAATESPTLRISPEIDRIEFHYTALSFIAPQQVQFKYKLEGLDRDWLGPTTERVARYTHLPPGAYRFRVLASNNDGVWNETGASLVLTVLPPWWRTGWFLTLAALFTVGAIAGAARLLTVRNFRQQMAELEREHALERERTRIAADLHDDVGSNLASIALLSRSANKAAPPESATDLAEIQQLAEQTAEAMRDIVWFIDASGNELQRLTLRMKETAVRLLTGIRWRFHTPPAIPDQKLSTEFKRHFFMIYKEALHNIVKHAQATEVEIEVKLSPNHVELIVQDNGVGIPELANRSGLGLTGMRRRAATLGWTLEIAPRASGGTAVRLCAAPAVGPAFARYPETSMGG